MPGDTVTATPFITPKSPYSSIPGIPRLHNYSRVDTLDAMGRDPDERRKKGGWILALSYATDWTVLIAVALVGFFLGNITPNKRPFSLEDPNISFPYTLHETVPTWLLMTANSLVPIVIIAIIALIFVPGATVPRGTPKSLIWKRKLWELHIGLLGLALSLASAWFLTSGMKNLYGKPRPDLIARCQPDLANLNQYIVGGIANFSSNGQLVSGDICKNPDKAVLDDGFRSYPSGHASSSAAGLVYLSLFIASKFAITLPFLTPAGYSDHSSFSAFPSRLIHRGPADVAASGVESYELDERPKNVRRNEALASPSDSTVQKRLALHNTTVASVRRQAAAPPLYLLLISLIPFFVAIFIASSRWFDFRHHGFDILFGFIIGTTTAFFAFRYYHLPISQGAGWAWGPRSRDKAFWAGVGSFSYATNHMRMEDIVRAGDEEEALGVGTGLERNSGDNAVDRKSPT